MDLRELGQLEQDLVFGDAGTKEVINFLRSKQVVLSLCLPYRSANSTSARILLRYNHDFLTLQDGMHENKLRLLMIYACVYPEKFEGDKALKLMQVAHLSLSLS